MSSILSVVLSVKETILRQLLLKMAMTVNRIWWCDAASSNPPSQEWGRVWLFFNFWLTFFDLILILLPKEVSNSDQVWPQLASIWPALFREQAATTLLAIKSSQQLVSALLLLPIIRQSRARSTEPEKFTKLVKSSTPVWQIGPRSF